MIFFVGTSQSNPIANHDNGKERTNFSGSYTLPKEVNIPNLDGQYDLSDVSISSTRKGAATQLFPRPMGFLAIEL